MDAKIPELFIKSLAGSYQEGTICCIMDIAETYPDRPAGMYDVARGQRRSLSEDPKTQKTAGYAVGNGRCAVYSSSRNEL